MLTSSGIICDQRLLLLRAVVAALSVSITLVVQAQNPCANPVACENNLAGNLPTEWDVVGSGDPTIQGFATDISVNRGQTVSFKISTTAASYRVDIYRLGYYGGRGARKVASVNPSAVQNQAACLRDAATGLVDCGNWTLSATWAVPANATSGVYIARPVRLDTGGASHIVFVVRDDAGQSDMVFQTSDTTWQAYNNYGGASLYAGNGPGAGGRAYKVSYNRPFNNRAAIPGDTTPLGFLFTAEYPMIRWLEANGYDLSYTTGVDTDRRGSTALILHKIFLSVGHDEYWSGTQRTNVEAARAAGVNLAFFSGNEIFWKTRWENSIAGPTTSYRTLVCYKETHANAKIDPTATWTGTWRDPRFSPPADGGRPENALSGQLFTVNGDRSDPMIVFSADGKLRFWRNTGLDTLLDGQVAQLPVGVLGFEWDEVVDNGFRPPGLFRLSTTTLRVDGHYLQDYGSHYGPGIATHSLSLYRHGSGALVFGAGTTQWAWGLDGTHDYAGTPPDSRMKQATANLFADMGVQPTTLTSGLLAASRSIDTTAPASSISMPPGLTVPVWSPLSLFGTATDFGGGRVAAVEISTDAGATWHPAEGTTNWAASWIPRSTGVVNVKSRAVDDSGRVETAGSGVALIVTENSARATLWPPETVPQMVDMPDASAVELGVRFSSERNGWITALRFYKSVANTGTHIGNLWANDGTLLATVTFAGETASGWQETPLATPVPVTAGTLYVASYHTDTGHYALDVDYFLGQGVNRVPLSAPADGVAGANGLYHYGTSAFPTNTSRSSNYWVDVAFVVNFAADITPPLITGVSPSVGASNARTLASVLARFNEPIAAATISGSNFFLKDVQNNLVPAVVAYDTQNRTESLQPSVPLNPGATYTATVKGGSLGVSDLAGNKPLGDFVWSFTVGDGTYTLWPPETVPQMVDMPDASAVELGVRFSSERNGWITALRFYKSVANTGTHIGNLWANDGTLLATVTFAGETASGWQETPLATPVPVTAGTLYVASYHTDTGHYALDVDYFLGQGVNRVPLSAPADGVAGANGLYHYGTSAFPTNTSRSSNYWVDVAFNLLNVTATPTFTPPAGAYIGTQAISISDTTPGAQIFFTMDGSTPTTSSARYTAPISLASTTTLKAIAAAPGWSTSPVSASTYTIQSTQTAPPTFGPGGGTYSTTQTVIITDSTPGAAIYYTTNGTTPTTSSTRYTSPITVSNPTTIKAIATSSGLTNSAVVSAVYAFQAAAPAFSPPGGTYTSVQSVTLSDVSAGASIYYTTNGTTPTTGSTRYTAAIPIGVTTTINAIAAVSGWANSAISTAAYTISPTGSTPTAPSALAAIAVSATQINLTWIDGSNNETGFKLERKTGASGTYAQIATPAANATSYSDSTLTASTTYFYRIRATNGAGDSTYSNEASATTLAATALPPPWLDRDIGSTGLAGSASYSGGTFTVRGSGADIWNTADAFHYVYQPMTGNADIVARVTGIQNTDAWAKAGVMIRETLAADSEHAFMMLSSANGVGFQRRISTGGSSTHTGGAAVATPYWVRLVRQGNTFTGYASSDVVTWTQVGTATISMVPTVYVGLAVTSHNNTLINQSTFTNVFLTTEPAPPSGLTATAASSSQINLAWIDNSSNESGFKIERKTGPSGTYAQIATIAAGVTTYSNTGLAGGTLYYYRVRSSNTAGDSGYSNEASATTTGSTTPAFRAKSSASATSGALTINKPAGTQQGDLMVAAVAVRPSTTTITPVAGWTLVRRLDNSNSNSNSLAIYYKVAGASEPTNYAWNFNSSAGSAGGIQSFSGINTSSPIDVDAGQMTNSLSLAAPSVTTHFANDMIVTSHGFASGATFTPPTGMTEAFEASSNPPPDGGGESMEGNYVLQPTIGATGAKTATAANDSDAGNAHTLALKAR